MMTTIEQNNSNQLETNNSTKLLYFDRPPINAALKPDWQNDKRKKKNNFIYKYNNCYTPIAMRSEALALTLPSSNDDVIETNNENSQNADAETLQKTPMFLINEIARYNKLQIQYVLEDETGPAHNKIFFVKLKLGNDEEYKANGSSIKKAQQSAAKIALDSTKYQHPKRQKKEKPQSPQSPQLTPTVHLNSLAMKLGYEAKYVFLTNPTKTMSMNRHSYGYTNFTSNEYNKPFSCPKFPNMGFNYMRNQQQQTICIVNLNLGDKTFHGEGYTRQKAKNNAANQALEFLSTLKKPENKVEKQDNSIKSENLETQPKEDTTNENVNTNELITSTIAVTPINDLKIEKSEISLVQEQATKRNLSVNYELIQESGPSHERKYVTRCTVGDYQTIGEGKSKKDSKKSSAIKMLEELAKIKPENETVANISKSNLNDKKKHKKRPKNIIKVIKENPDYGKGTLNPICRLIQIQQANKGPEPVYKLVEEKKKFRRYEFIIEVSVGETAKCQGNGNSKRKAKQNAAEAMLIQLGYKSTQSQIVKMPPKPVLKTQSNKQSENVVVEKKVKFVDIKDETDNKQVKEEASIRTNKESNRNMFNKKYKEMQQQQSKQKEDFTETLNTASLIANDLLNKGHSEIIDSIQKNTVVTDKTTINSSDEQVKAEDNPPSYIDKLRNIANLLNFNVQFRSLTKKDGICSYVSLSILVNDNKSLTGKGETSFESQNEAALCALKYLAEKCIPKQSEQLVSLANADVVTEVSEASLTPSVSNNSIINEMDSSIDSSSSSFTSSTNPSTIKKTSSQSSISSLTSSSSSSSVVTVILNNNNNNNSY